MPRLHFFSTALFFNLSKWNRPINLQQMEIHLTATHIQTQILWIPSCHLGDITSSSLLGYSVYSQRQVGDFLDELDTLLSFFPEHNCPMLVLGDLSIHLDALRSSDFLRLIHSFGLLWICSPPTHKVGKEIDLILTWNWATDTVSSTLQHILLPTVEMNDVSESLLYTELLAWVSTHSFCLDNLCLLSTRPTQFSHSRPWLSDGSCTPTSERTKRRILLTRPRSVTTVVQHNSGKEGWNSQCHWCLETILHLQSSTQLSITIDTFAAFCHWQSSTYQQAVNWTDHTKPVSSCKGRYQTFNMLQLHYMHSSIFPGLCH